MAIMFLDVRRVARGHGGSAVAKAAYIARERLYDMRTGTLHDYRRVGGLEHAEILLPAGAPATARDWARDRGTLWNRAESSERQRNSRVATEYIVALPHELRADTRLLLARDFAQSIADRYGATVDLAVHGPTPRGDPRNHHAHLLATTRELALDGFGRKTAAELGTRERRELGLAHIAVEFRDLRAHWAGLANEKLRAANLEVRLEPRSRATLAREQWERERAQAAGRAPEETVAPVAVPAPPPEARPAEPGAERALTIDEIRQRAVERWRAYRAGHTEERGPAAEREHSRDRGADAGFEL